MEDSKSHNQSLRQSWGHTMQSLQSNNESLMCQSGEGGSSTKTASSNLALNGIDNLVKFFNNPSILFQKNLVQQDALPTRINDVEMEAEVALEADCKRMRGVDSNDKGRKEVTVGSGVLSVIVVTNNNNVDLHFFYGWALAVELAGIISSVGTVWAWVTHKQFLRYVT